jgi:hypothetical protein
MSDGGPLHADDPAAHAEFQRYLHELIDGVTHDMALGMTIDEALDQIDG